MRNGLAGTEFEHRGQRPRTVIAAVILFHLGLQSISRLRKHSLYSLPGKEILAADSQRWILIRIELARSNAVTPACTWVSGLIFLGRGSTVALLFGFTMA